MISEIMRLRELVDSRYGLKKYQERRQELNDPALRERLARVVDAIVLNAVNGAGQADVWIEPNSRHTTAYWPTVADDTAQQTIFADGRRDHGIYREPAGLAGRLFPDDGPWLFASSEDESRVCFMPGDGFESAEAFLEHVAIEAGVHRH